MGVYAVTGLASGMGRKVADKLCDAGHTVIGVDIKHADIVADLSTVEGRPRPTAFWRRRGPAGRRRSRSRSRPGPRT